MGIIAGGTPGKGVDSLGFVSKGHRELPSPVQLGNKKVVRTPSGPFPADLPGTVLSLPLSSQASGRLSPQKLGGEASSPCARFTKEDLQCAGLTQGMIWVPLVSLLKIPCQVSRF